MFDRRACWSAVQRPPGIFYKNACLCFSIHFRLKKAIFLEFLQFSHDVVGARVGAIWSVRTPTPHPGVYIGPTLKYSAPILSLDLSKYTGNGSCFPLSSQTFIQTEP